MPPDSTTSRTALVHTSTGDKILPVTHTPSGFYMVNYYKNSDDTWCVLGANGKILLGPDWCKSWLPVSGWIGDEKFLVSLP